MYFKRLEMLSEYYLGLNDSDLMNTESIVLTKVRLYKRNGQPDKAYELLSSWIESHPDQQCVT